MLANGFDVVFLGEGFSLKGLVGAASGACLIEMLVLRADFDNGVVATLASFAGGRGSEKLLSMLCVLRFCLRFALVRLVIGYASSVFKVIYGLNAT